jgi:hypothetical protein
MNVALVALPAAVDLRCYQGDDFTFTLTVTNPDGSAMNLTGYAALAQVRSTQASSSPLCTFTTSIGGTSNNVVTLTLPHATSSTLPAGNAVWDCQVTSAGGIVTTLAGGQFILAAEVTR